MKSAGWSEVPPDMGQSVHIVATQLGLTVSKEK